MTNLQTLLEQRQALDTQINSVRQSERAEAVRKIREIAAQYGIDAVKELSSSGRVSGGKGASASKGSVVAAKYRDSATGNTWSGRGLKPRWLQEQLNAGRSLEEFTLAPASV